MTDREREPKTFWPAVRPAKNRPKDFSKKSGGNIGFAIFSFFFHFNEQEGKQQNQTDFFLFLPLFEILIKH